MLSLADIGTSESGELVPLTLILGVVWLRGDGPLMLDVLCSYSVRPIFVSVEGRIAYESVSVGIGCKK